MAYREPFLCYVTGSTSYSCGKIKGSVRFFKRSKSHYFLNRLILRLVSDCQNQQQTTRLSFGLTLFVSFDPTSRFIYPAVVSLFIATLYFPPGLGQFLVSTLTTRQQIMSLFSNFTWMGDDLTAEQSEIVSHWTNEYSNLFVTLGIYMATTVFALNTTHE